MADTLTQDMIEEGMARAEKLACGSEDSHAKGSLPDRLDRG